MSEIATKSKLLKKLGKELFLFLAVGLPAFAIAFPLNYVFVELCGLHKAIAYAIVLFVQVNINFPLCRKFVFTPSQQKPLYKQYLEFMASVAFFRFFDWLFYTFCVEALEFEIIVFGKNCYYLIYQLLNVIIFSIAKFLFCKRAIEGKNK